MDALTNEQLREIILTYGFYHQQDFITGKRVDEIAERGFPLKTDEGLYLCKESTFDNECVRVILKSVFPWSGLGCYKALGHDPHRVFCFLGSNKPKVQALIVQLWSHKSRVIFYKGSHLQALRPKPATNGFLEISPENLTHESIEHIEIEMEEGGLTIIDGRLGFKIIHGLAINFGFATEEELKKWAPMRLPNLQSLVDIVATMKSEALGNNFEFVERK